MKVQLCTGGGNNRHLPTRSGENSDETGWLVLFSSLLSASFCSCCTTEVVLDSLKSLDPSRDLLEVAEPIEELLPLLTSPYRMKTDSKMRQGCTGQQYWFSLKRRQLEKCVMNTHCPPNKPR